eukprot:1158483-Pelagomonas_calceolata.AAC.5
MGERCSTHALAEACHGQQGSSEYRECSGVAFCEGKKQQHQRCRVEDACLLCAYEEAMHFWEEVQVQRQVHGQSEDEGWST